MFVGLFVLQRHQPVGLGGGVLHVPLEVGQGIGLTGGMGRIGMEDRERPCPLDARSQDRRPLPGELGRLEIPLGLLLEPGDPERQAVLHFLGEIGQRPQVVVAANPLAKDLAGGKERVHLRLAIGDLRIDAGIRLGAGDDGNDHGGNQGQEDPLAAPAFGRGVGVRSSSCFRPPDNRPEHCEAGDPRQAE